MKLILLALAVVPLAVWECLLWLGDFAGLWNYESPLYHCKSRKVPFLPHYIIKKGAPR